MKKVLSVLLSLIFMLGILAIPATAQGNYSNKVPKTVTWYYEKVGIETRIGYLEKNTQFTANYNTSKKELIYNISFDNNGINDLLEAIYIGLASASTDTKINQDYARCAYMDSMNPEDNDPYNDSYDYLKRQMIDTGVVINDSIRTGKIQKLIIKMGDDTNDPINHCTMTFATKGNHVTEMAISGFYNGTFKYSYDSNGNITQIESTYGKIYTITIQHKENQVTLIQGENPYAVFSKDEIVSYIPKYDNSGNLTYIKYKEEKIPSVKQKLHNHYYKYQLSYNQDKTISTFDDTQSYYTYTYFSI